MTSRLCYRRHGCDSPQFCTAVSRCPATPDIFDKARAAQVEFNRRLLENIQAHSKAGLMTPNQSRSRFDYIAYDAESSVKQAAFKAQFQLLEQMAGHHLRSPRWRQALIDKLEEAYMAVGKAIRDDQIDRAKCDYAMAPLQEARGNE